MHADRAPRHDYPGIVGSSTALHAALAKADRILDLDDPVLLEGETGTGKELLARAIHALGPRAAAPFVALNCSAIPESLLEGELFGSVKGAYTGAETDRPGLFEAADRGTIFLDEIEAMPEAMQKKLLRVLDSRTIRRVGAPTETPVDVRILAATNEPLRERVEQNLLRKDFYYRISAFPIILPPLRARTEDLPSLAGHLLKEAALESRTDPRELTSEALALLRRYSWPGNVRELRNEMRRLAMEPGSPIRVAHLSPHIRNHPSGADAPTRKRYRQRLSDFEKRILLEALEDHGWNLSAAARALEMDRHTLRSKMRTYKIDRKK